MLLCSVTIDISNKKKEFIFCKKNLYINNLSKTYTQGFSLVFDDKNKVIEELFSPASKRREVHFGDVIFWEMIVPLQIFYHFFSSQIFVVSTPI